MHIPFRVTTWYYNDASTFSNMNIFSSILTSENMMAKTSPTAMEDDFVGGGDYLR